MIYSEVIIVGGGPAGSTCAWKLRESGIDCLILDKENFPRLKLCAGWITPKVVKDLKIDINSYPYSLNLVDCFRVSIFGITFKLRAKQYSIRRWEFDEWLLKRSAVKVETHPVKEIHVENGFYIIDGKYRCRYLIGAGGAFCPVYDTFFKAINPRATVIVTMEQEFAYNYKDPNCHLWFFENKFPGYSWYVPKGMGHLNIGVGGSLAALKAKHRTIRDAWEYFVRKLNDLSLVKDYQFAPKGCIYYLRGNIQAGQIGNAFIVGDALGLATRDLGEGIEPAVESGMEAAKAIINGTKYSVNSIKKYSLQFYKRWPLMALLTSKLFD